jgi:hypothetical protein
MTNAGNSTDKSEELEELEELEEPKGGDDNEDELPEQEDNLPEVRRYQQWKRELKHIHIRIREEQIRRGLINHHNAPPDDEPTSNIAASTISSNTDDTLQYIERDGLRGFKVPI